MSDVFWGALWGNMPTLIGVLASIVLGVLHRRKLAGELDKAVRTAEATKAVVTNGLSSTVQEVHEATKEIYQATNGMKAELVRATAALEYAKGVLAGRQQVVEEQKSNREMTGGAK